MSELSCDTPFIGRNETLDLSLYRLKSEIDAVSSCGVPSHVICHLVLRKVCQLPLPAAAL